MIKLFSKYPHPAELLKNEAMTNEQKQKIKEIYINDIQKEMIQVTHFAPGRFGGVTGFFIFSE